jgi:hypothetical protein
MLNDQDLERYIKQGQSEPHRTNQASSEELQPGATPAQRSVSSGNGYWEMMEAAGQAFSENAAQLRTRTGNRGGSGDGRPDFKLMEEMEKCFARFAEGLLEGALLPYWQSRSQRLVDREDLHDLPIKARYSEATVENAPASFEFRTGVAEDDPMFIRVGEEFLAIRYTSLLRSVLVNMRRLMSFISASFVLAIVAWNTYPFEPRQMIDWIFTALLIILGFGVVCVLAQIHRDPILSRITHTSANELGVDFWGRLISLGAIPVLTWLAYTFPDVGTFLYKFFQPAVTLTH